MIKKLLHTELPSKQRPTGIASVVPQTSISAILQVTVSPRKNTAARKEAGRETQRDCDCSCQDSNRSAVREVLASHHFTPWYAEIYPKAPNRARITLFRFLATSVELFVLRVFWLKTTMELQQFTQAAGLFF